MVRLVSIENKHLFGVDIFKFFLPFLDPACLSQPLTKVELEELLHFITLLRRVFDAQVERNRPFSNRTVNQEKLESVSKALKFLEDSLRAVLKDHQGDTIDTLKMLLDRRSKVPGWEEWTYDLQQKLKSLEIKKAG